MNSRSRRASFVARGLVVLALGAGPVAGQSFNIDAGSGSVPSVAYGAAAGRPGTWNRVDKALGQPGIPLTPLVDVEGNATGVSFALVPVGFASMYSFGHDSPIEGDAAALLEDWIDIHSGGPSVGASIVLTGLSAGSYDVFTYAAVLDLVTPSVVGGMVVTGNWNGDLGWGSTYALHRVEMTGGNLSLFVQASNTFSGVAALNGMQIVKLDGGSRSLCAGTNATCPCGNGGSGGAGCASSFNSNGALLVASGIGSVSTDSLVLDASGVSNALVVLVQGSQASQGGVGSAFGDGLLCAGGTLIRLASKIGSGNAVRYPEGPEVPISIRGLLTPAGGTRVYQARYRNAAPFCTSGGFNTTNGVAVSWTL